MEPSRTATPNWVRILVPGVFPAAVPEDREIGGSLTDFHSRPEPLPGMAADLGRRIVAPIATRFGRLVFLCSLRDPLTGRYAHPALVESVGREVADRSLCHQHHQIFAEWLRLNLGDQKADVAEYLSSTRLQANDLPYRELAPASAHEVERELYLADLEVIVQLLSFEQETAVKPGAWPRR